LILFQFVFLAAEQPNEYFLLDLLLPIRFLNFSEFIFFSLFFYCFADCNKATIVPEEKNIKTCHIRQMDNYYDKCGDVNDLHLGKHAGYKLQELI